MSPLPLINLTAGTSNAPRGLNKMTLIRLVISADNQTTDRTYESYNVDRNMLASSCGYKELRLSVKNN